MTGGKHDRGVCMAGGMCDRGHVWQGELCLRGHVCMAGGMTTAADGTHATGMHFCLNM